MQPMDVPMTRRRWSTPRPFSTSSCCKRDHVGVFVLRKAGVEAVAGLAGFSVADVVGQDDEVLGRVEQLAGTEEHAGEYRPQKSRSAAAGAVKDEDGVGGVSAGVFDRLAERGVVDADFGEGLAGLEMEVVDDEIAFLGRGPGRRLRAGLPGHELDGRENDG